MYLHPAKKMEDPSYGTHPENEIPVYSAQGVRARVLAGPFSHSRFSACGPCKFKVDVQVLDIALEAGASFVHTLPPDYDNCLIYAYGRKGIMSTVSGTHIKPGQVEISHTHTHTHTHQPHNSNMPMHSSLNVHGWQVARMDCTSSQGSSNRDIVIQAAQEGLKIMVRNCVSG